MVLYKHMQSYDKLWPVSSKVIMMSHGQAQVERGFSTNEKISEVNQSEESLIARRAVKDHIMSAGGFTEMVITEDLVTLGILAHSRYKEYLEEKRREQERQARKRKRTYRRTGKPQEEMGTGKI